MIDRCMRTLPMTGRTVLVDAWERWSDTGIDVQPRDLLLFEASGTIRVGDSAGDVTAANGSGGHRTLDVPMLDPESWSADRPHRLRPAVFRRQQSCGSCADDRTPVSRRE